MSFDARLKHLVDLSAPYWAAAREVVRTHFHSARRNAETDRLWLRRQCFKELWGSGVADRVQGLFQWRATCLADIFARIDRGTDRHARACEQVQRDEIGHTRRGLIGLGSQELAAREWEELQDKITAILRQRLHMRNEQFSFPVATERMRVLQAGASEPIAFDYETVA